MKKSVSMLLVVICLLVTAVTLFAAETTFEGEYRVRAITEWNFDKKPAPGPADYESLYDGWFEQRFNLTITHERSEYLRAVISFDLVEDTWGQGRSFFINATNVGDYIDLAYLEFTVPPIGTFTIGEFDDEYGYGLAFSNPGINGVRWSNSWGPVALSAMYSKVTDNVTTGPNQQWYNWDADLWSLDLKITPNDNHMIELFGGIVTDNDADGAGGIGGILNNSYVVTTNGLGGWSYDATIGFVGLAYSGTIADMFEIKFENSWVFGGADFHQLGALGSPVPVVGPSPLNPYRDPSISGWNVYLDVSYFNDLFTLGLAFIMGSGEAHYWNPASLKQINMNYIAQDGFAWGRIIGGAANVDDQLNSYWPDNALWSQRSIENLTSVKLYFEICPIEKLTLSAAVIWARWTNPVGSIVAGGIREGVNAPKGPAYGHPANIYAPGVSGNTYESWDVSDDLGWEIDFGLSYEIMEGLTYTFSAGVLLTGSSWDYVNWDGTRASWGPIWSISNEIMFEF